MIRSVTSYVIALCLAGPFATSARAQAAPPEAQVHHAHAGALDASGWTVASSTDGAFSVRLPCLFKDVTYTLKDASASAKRMSVLTCDRADGVRFFAGRAEYKDAAAGQQTFKDFPGADMSSGAELIRGTHEGLPTVQANIAAGGKCAWMKILRVGSDNLMMIVEPINVACSDLGAVAKQYFDSVKVQTR